jgi:hypothetical protein
MDEILKFLGTHFAQELAVITGAPIITLITTVVLGAIMYFAMGAYYSHSLVAKDSVIEILRARLEHGNSDAPTQPLPSLPPVEQSASSKATTEATSLKEAPTSEPLIPNIVAVRGQIKWLPKRIDVDNDTGIRRLRRCQAFIAIFRNLPLPERDIGSAGNVTASIVYDCKGLEFAEVTKGIWIEENEEWRSNKVEFKPDSVRRLILARESDIGQFVAHEDYSDSGSASVLSRTGYGNGVPLDIPTGTQCTATVRFAIDGRADQRKYRFNLGFGENPYCGREEDADTPF